jgi:hypothetical protein
MGITKLKEYQVEENNNSDLSLVELINNDHEEDKDDTGENKDDTNKKIVKTELTQSGQQILTKDQPIPK